MTFHTEFPDFPADEMPLVPALFNDCSWRNDICPIFVSEAIGLQISIDYKDPNQREFPDGKRFTVMPQHGGFETYGPMLDTDDWNVVLDFIIERTKTVIADVSLGRADGDLDGLNNGIKTMFDARG